MSNNGIVKIHGKDYMTVAGRVELAHKDNALESIVTEVLEHHPVVVKATVTVKGQVWTGISSVDPATAREIEKLNPYEVAETSAVGRALGFAGYGIIESIASADEVTKSEAAQQNQEAPDDFVREPEPGDQARAAISSAPRACSTCGEPANYKAGVSKAGKAYRGYFCTGDKNHVEWL